MVPKLCTYRTAQWSQVTQNTSMNFSNHTATLMHSYIPVLQDQASNLSKATCHFFSYPHSDILVFSSSTTSTTTLGQSLKMLNTFNKHWSVRVTRNTCWYVLSPLQSGGGTSPALFHGCTRLEAYPSSFKETYLDPHLLFFLLSYSNRWPKHKSCYHSRLSSSNHPTVGDSQTRAAQTPGGTEACHYSFTCIL